MNRMGVVNWDCLMICNLSSPKMLPNNQNQADRLTLTSPQRVFGLKVARLRPRSDTQIAFACGVGFYTQISLKTELLRK